MSNTNHQPTRSTRSTRLGQWGEEQAALFLQRQGYEIVERRWRCRFGEIDLIARNREYLIFVEVKLRKNAAFAHAREFVDFRKQEKLRTTARLYLASHPTRLQPRFDVAEVYAPYGIQTRQPEIRYWENAF